MPERRRAAGSPPSKRRRSDVGPPAVRRLSAVGAPPERRRAAVISAVGNVLLGQATWNLFALPARLGGLGLHIPSKVAAIEYHASKQVTSTLCDHILSQDPDYNYEIIAMQLEAKAQISREAKERVSSEFNEVYENMPASLRRAIDLATEKGSSTWLTALPVTEHGFTLHKSAFHDALALRYGWSPSEMPSKCACGNNFSVEHALSCAKGGHIVSRSQTLSGRRESGILPIVELF